MNLNSKDEHFDDMEVPPPELNENSLMNTDTMDTHEEPRPRHNTAPLGAPYQYPAYPPPEVQPDVYQEPPQLRPRPRRRRWPWVVGCLFVLLVLLAALAAGAVVFGFAFQLGPSTTTTHHYTVGTHPTIIVNNDIGTIVVHTGGAPNVVTIAETRTNTLFGGSPNSVQAVYNQSNDGNTITVAVNRPAGTSFFNITTVNFDISVPSITNLQLSTSTGSVSVNGINGTMSLQSGTGSVSASQVGLTASSLLKTNTGLVNFSGTIGTSGTYQFQSNTGTVSVTLPRSASFRLNAKTSTGTFNTGFPGIHVQHNTVGSQASGNVGSSPTSTVTLTTNTGTITLNAGS